MLDSVPTAQAKHLQGEIDKLPIMKGMTGIPGQLVNVLKQHRVYNTFFYTRVQALATVLANFNEAMKKEIKLFDTLVGVYGGVAKYARVLSVAKAGVLTGKMILPLQTELVKSLHWETLDDLLVLLKLDLKRDSLTYEALDTVVTCAALRYKLSVDDALYATFTGLRAMYTDEIVKDAIKKGRGEIISANFHLVHKFGADLTTLGKEENEYADLLESWFDPNTVVPSLTINIPIRAAGTSLDEKSLELSLKPPGT